MADVLGHDCESIHHFNLQYSFRLPIHGCSVHEHTLVERNLCKLLAYIPDEGKCIQTFI